MLLVEMINAVDLYVSLWMFPTKVAGISGAYLTSTDNSPFSFFLLVVKHIPAPSVKM